MDKKRKVKASTSFSISAKCKYLLRALAERMGISQTGVIELLVREKAEEKGISDG